LSSNRKLLDKKANKFSKWGTIGEFIEGDLLYIDNGQTEILQA